MSSPGVPAAAALPALPREPKVSGGRRVVDGTGSGLRRRRPRRPQKGGPPGPRPACCCFPSWVPATGLQQGAEQASLDPGRRLELQEARSALAGAARRGAEHTYHPVQGKAPPRFFRSQGPCPRGCLVTGELDTQRPAVAELTYEEGWWDQEVVRRAGRWYLPGGPPRAWLLPAPAAVSCAAPLGWVLLQCVL